MNYNVKYASSMTLGEAIQKLRAAESPNDMTGKMAEEVTLPNLKYTTCYTSCLIAVLLLRTKLLYIYG